jgi:DNA replication factor GINS
VDLDELKSVRRTERETSTLQHLRDSFYRDVASYIESRKDEYRRQMAEADDPFAASEEVSHLKDEVEAAENVVEAIYERRVGKVVKMAAFAAAGMSTEEDGLTAEERDLFDDLVERIRGNREVVLDGLVGDGPAAVDGATGDGVASDADTETGPGEPSPGRRPDAPAGDRETDPDPASTPELDRATTDAGPEPGTDPEPGADPEPGPGPGPDPGAGAGDDGGVLSEAMGGAGSEAGGSGPGAADGAGPGTGSPSPTETAAGTDSGTGTVTGDGDGGDDRTARQPAEDRSPAVDDAVAGPPAGDGETDGTAGPADRTGTGTDSTAAAASMASSTSRASADSNPRESGSGSGSGSRDSQSRTGGGETSRMTVRVTSDVGSILGVDEREYDLASEDVVTLPATNARPLVERGAAERLDGV